MTRITTTLPPMPRQRLRPLSNADGLSSAAPNPHDAEPSDAETRIIVETETEAEEDDVHPSVWMRGVLTTSALITHPYV
jgi:hypothetical protein